MYVLQGIYRLIRLGVRELSIELLYSFCYHQTRQGFRYTSDDFAKCVSQMKYNW